ncbi:hypothetical protein M8C21_016396, partial [Ambrosia artemisiifolia]
VGLSKHAKSKGIENMLLKLKVAEYTYHLKMVSSSSSVLMKYALVIFYMGVVSAQLSTNFYSNSCPKLLPTVRSAVQSAISKETRMGASLLRLHFHDCFVNLVFAMNLMKLGGPTWGVKLGRRDSRTASQAAANSSIPPPTSSLSALISSFRAAGLSAKDMVALSGSHTIGQARCTNFRARIYNETNNLEASFATQRRSNCPRATGSGDNNLAPLDVQSPTTFNNDYFKNLINQKGLLHSDQQLFNGGSADSTVRQYSSNPNQFSADFAAAMIKMGDNKPLTGSSGEIRKNCRRPN